MKGKKLLSLLLALLMLAGLLTACGGAAKNSAYVMEESAAEAPMAMAADSAAGLTANSTAESGALPENRKWIITVDMNAETDDLDTMTADIFWRNETEQTAYYSAHFRVERLEGEEWVYCAPEPLPFTDEGYELAPREENHHTYNLDRFDLSQPGSYRIAADFTLAGDAVYTLWADFTLIGEERNEEMDMDPAGYSLDPCGCIVDGPLDPTESP